MEKINDTRSALLPIIFSPRCVLISLKNWNNGVCLNRIITRRRVVSECIQNTCLGRYACYHLLTYFLF